MKLNQMASWRQHLNGTKNTKLGEMEWKGEDILGVPKKEHYLFSIFPPSLGTSGGLFFNIG